jgi:hypothetical protein
VCTSFNLGVYGSFRDKVGVLSLCVFVRRFSAQRGH